MLEGEVVRKCLTRIDRQCNFFSHRDVKVVYRRYASLYFIAGIDGVDEVRMVAAARLSTDPVVTAALIESHILSLVLFSFARITH